MEIILRLLQAIANFIYLFVHPFLNWKLPRKTTNPMPPISNKLITLSVVEVVAAIQLKKISCEQLVLAYIERIKKVEHHINAVIEDRFEAAQKDAKRADGLIARASSSNEELRALFARYPLLGVPFTVKEACGLKGMSFVVGSVQRLGERCKEDSSALECLRAAGAIPLLVSANPEYCFSIETNTYIKGKCLNAYDNRRSAGGSSGGEGALNGAGASLFGIGSDIAGSIRIPSLFNGVFGHKPTGGLVSVKGHYPDSNDPDYDQYLQLGPITRFGRDLGLITQILAGRNAHKLDQLTLIETKNIKIFYSLGFTGLNGVLHHAVAFDMQLAIMKAVRYFAQMGLHTQRAHIAGFKNSTEIALSSIVRIQGFPFLINNSKKWKVLDTLWELFKSICGWSQYTKEGLIFELMRRGNGFMPKKNLSKYKTEGELLKKELIQLLGQNGVLFFPTFHVPAIHLNTSLLPLYGIDYTLIFNALGLPATHIPMGLGEDRMPVGFQVVAAPFMDKLCFQIAGELEEAFGGWVSPTS